MTNFTRIITGLLLGTAGFFEIPYDPAAGCSALFVSGILLISGMEKLWSLKCAPGASRAVSLQPR